jgi:hypothetical protein
VNPRRAGRVQRKPETVGQLAEWQRRTSDYLRSGVGGDGCLTGTCAVQGAYGTGEGYGPPNPACDPCAVVMLGWNTAVVPGTDYRRVPRGGLDGATAWGRDTPGVTGPDAAVAVPEQRSGSDVAEVTE